MAAAGYAAVGPVGSRGPEGLIAGTKDTGPLGAPGRHQSSRGDGPHCSGQAGGVWAPPGQGRSRWQGALRPPSRGTGREGAGQAGGLRGDGLQGPRAPGGPRLPRGGRRPEAQAPRHPPPRPSIPLELVFLFSPQAQMTNDKNRSIPDASGHQRGRRPCHGVASVCSSAPWDSRACPRSGNHGECSCQRGRPRELAAGWEKRGAGGLGGGGWHRRASAAFVPPPAGRARGQTGAPGVWTRAGPWRCDVAAPPSPQMCFLPCVSSSPGAPATP